MKTANTKRLLVISSYPPKGATHHPSIIGGAAYTKNTLVNLREEILARGETAEITVLAEKLKMTQNAYTDQGIKVKRIWKRNSFFTYPILLREVLLHYKQTKNVLIELELGVFGYNAFVLAL